MSKIEVNAIEPQCGTDLTVGASGDTITFPTGTTIVNNGTQTGFGRTGTVDWDTTPKTATFSAVSGNGYFCNTSGGAFTVNLPAGVAGAIISVADYAATWQTNNVTVTPNGTDKIGSLNSNALLNTQGQSVTFVYVDSTQGWINTMDSTSNVRGISPFINATGGTITESGDYKIHTFTGAGTFCVSSISPGPSGNPNSVDYLVVAGGGGGGGAVNDTVAMGGGGAGGYRESPGTATGSYTVSPLGVSPAAAITVSVTGYPIAVGGGGTGGGAAPAVTVPTSGINSTFSTIISTGGGNGTSRQTGPGVTPAGTGGSGGGGSWTTPAAAGNTPPVSPSQGNSGGALLSPPIQSGGGGGGAIAVGGTHPQNGGAGGAGATSSINATPTTRAGGGGGGGGYIDNATVTSGGAGGAGGGGAGGNSKPSTPGCGTAGTINTGGGGGGGGGQSGPAPNVNTVGGSGGSGIVIIRYRFQ